jgi:hypothetical protein
LAFEGARFYRSRQNWRLPVDRSCRWDRAARRCRLTGRIWEAKRGAAHLRFRRGLRRWPARARARGSGTLRSRGVAGHRSRRAMGGLLSSARGLAPGNLTSGGVRLLVLADESPAR